MLGFEKLFFFIENDFAKLDYKGLKEIYNYIYKKIIIYKDIFAYIHSFVKFFFKEFYYVKSLHIIKKKNYNNYISDS